ncbi:MAG: AAA family ATPase [Tropheryma whipplei]|nr:AAA family ATPase [Tropheryma whipplei]Q83N78.1 RecName: Full=Chaperone protein ClpB [Tropheryma whipplei TW08/27]MCO8182443.1 AAA family ATPase [Tropheryma whipplei]MCO8190287.1 AAA family ATPase [Tropheryma whipplei]CAD67417.1 heat shock protein ClpB [Tropheryma whipplei TW08/27]
MSESQSELDKYGTNLTKTAATNKLDPVIGRDAEIRRVCQILSRRTKNNPVLIGSAGVGKTAIVEGLAQRIVAGDVPESLRNKEIVSLDLSALLAGASYRGEFEKRVKNLLEEIQKSKVIIFIDEVHTLMSAGAAEGAIAAGNMLKPLLARGELRLIGATTLDEYREHLEKDPALERRFQQVFVGEPNLEDCIAIMRGLKERYEAHHKVSISDTALVTAVELSSRYITGRQLPDKAIDLLDEAASSLRMEIDSSPVELDQLRREVDRLRLEELALKSENDPTSEQRLRSITNQLSGKQEMLNTLQASWNSERARLNQIGALKEQIDIAKQSADIAQREGRLEDASRLLYATIPQLQKNLAEKLEEQDSAPLVSDQVMPEDIASVVEGWTGIPVKKLMQKDAKQLLHLEEDLSKSVIAQKVAIGVIADAVRRSRAGLSDPNRPSGTFLFLGPTGVGKTQLVKALASLLYDGEIVRIDMSEYSEKFSISRLIGAPPGYIGHESAGQLTESVRRRPYSVVLFDEAEKAHPEVFDILLQVLDEGRLTDSHGRTVDFRNTIIVLTSNIGSRYLSDISLEATTAHEYVNDEVRRTFRPEFLNRLDEIVIFEPLSQSDICQIVDLNIESLNKRIKDRRIVVTVSEDLRRWLSKSGYDVIYGARPLRRLIQREIEDRLAKLIIEGLIHDGQTASFDLSGGAVNAQVCS